MQSSTNGTNGQSRESDPDLVLVSDEQSGTLSQEDSGKRNEHSAKGAQRRRIDRVRPTAPDRPNNFVSVVQQLTERARTKTIQPPFDPDTAESCPFFWELMTLATYDGDKDRFLPIMSITRVDSGHECVIQDIETGQETRFLFTTYQDLPRAAERHLTSPGCVWKPFKNRRNMKGIERHDKKKS